MKSYILIAFIGLFIFCNTKNKTNVKCKTGDTLFNKSLYVCIPDSFTKLSDSQFRHIFFDDSRELTMVAFMANDSSGIFIDQYPTTDIQLVLNHNIKQYKDHGYSIKQFDNNKVCAYVLNKDSLYDISIANIISNKKSVYSLVYNYSDKYIKPDFSIIDNYLFLEAK